jgi:hypothetical protein
VAVGGRRGGAGGPFVSGRPAGGGAAVAVFCLPFADERLGFDAGKALTVPPSVCRLVTFFLLLLFSHCRRVSLYSLVPVHSHCNTKILSLKRY